MEVQSPPRVLGAGWKVEGRVECDGEVPELDNSKFCGELLLAGVLYGLFTEYLCRQHR